MENEMKIEEKKASEIWVNVMLVVLCALLALAYGTRRFMENREIEDRSLISMEQVLYDSELQMRELVASAQSEEAKALLEQVKKNVLARQWQEYFSLREGKKLTPPALDPWSKAAWEQMLK